MGRPLRIEYPGALYHLTSRGNERRKIFRDDSDKVKFLEILEEYHDRFGILLHGYVLMDNHYHLIMETPQGNLLKVMHGINSRYTGYFNRKYKRSGHLFQGRYKGILVEKEAYLHKLSKYVHLNPVRAGMVEWPEMYPWSSYPGFIRKSKAIKWVEYAGILSTISPDIVVARREYKKFVKEGLNEKQESPVQELCGQIILGGEKFVEKIKSMLNMETISQEIVERKSLGKCPSAEAILESVASAFDVKKESLKEKALKKTTARKMAIYLMKRHTGLGNAEIGEIFGGLHYSAVSKVASRFESATAGDTKLSTLAKTVISNVKT